MSARGPAQCSGHKWYAAAFKLAPRAVTPARGCGAVGPLPGALPGACVGGPRPCPRGRRRPSLGAGCSPGAARCGGLGPDRAPLNGARRSPRALGPRPALRCLRAAPAGRGGPGLLRVWRGPVAALPGSPSPGRGAKDAPRCGRQSAAALPSVLPPGGGAGRGAGQRAARLGRICARAPPPGVGGVFLLVLRSFRQLSTNRCIRVSGPAARPEAPLARLFMAAAGSAISSPGSRSASKCGEYPGLSVRVGLTRQPGCDTLE